MKFIAQQINAIVDTLEKKFNEKEEAKNKLEAPQKELDYNARAAKIVVKLNSLDLDIKEIIGRGIYINKSNNFTIKDVADVLKEIEEDKIIRLNFKKSKNKSHDVFDREEIKRQVIMKTLEVDSVEDLLKAFGIEIKKSVSKPAVSKQVPNKKVVTKKANSKK